MFIPKQVATVIRKARAWIADVVTDDVSRAGWEQVAEQEQPRVAK